MEDRVTAGDFFDVAIIISLRVKHNGLLDLAAPCQFLLVFDLVHKFLERVCLLFRCGVLDKLYDACVFLDLHCSWVRFEDLDGKEFVDWLISSCVILRNGNRELGFGLVVFEYQIAFRRNEVLALICRARVLGKRIGRELAADLAIGTSSPDYCDGALIVRNYVSDLTLLTSETQIAWLIVVDNKNFGGRVGVGEGLISIAVVELNDELPVVVPLLVVNDPNFDNHVLLIPLELDDLLFKWDGFVVLSFFGGYLSGTDSNGLSGSRNLI